MRHWTIKTTSVHFHRHIKHLNECYYNYCILLFVTSTIFMVVSIFITIGVRPWQTHWMGSISVVSSFFIIYCSDPREYVSGIWHHSLWNHSIGHVRHFGNDCRKFGLWSIICFSLNTALHSIFNLCIRFRIEQPNLHGDHIIGLVSIASGRMEKLSNSVRIRWTTAANLCSWHQTIEHGNVCFCKPTGNMICWRLLSQFFNFFRPWRPSIHMQCCWSNRKKKKKTTGWSTIEWKSFGWIVFCVCRFAFINSTAEQ